MRKLIILFIFAFFVSIMTKSQENVISIKFIGNCGFYLSNGDFSFYLDFPYRPGAYGYMDYDERIIDTVQPSVCIFTHGHADHFKKRFFRKTKSRLFGPWPVRALVAAKRTISLNELNDTVPGFSIKYFKTPHGLSLRHYSYFIVWHGKRIYISGDTHDKEHLLALKNLDVAIVNPWLLIDISDSKQRIDTKKIILCHHRLNDKITGTSDKFIVPRQNEELIIE